MMFPGFGPIAPAKRALAAAALVATLAIAGCGGDESGSDANSNGAGDNPAATSIPTTPPAELPDPPSAEVRTAAAKAKAQADTTFTALRACYRKKKDYSKCAAETTKSLDRVVKQGTDAGQVEITGDGKNFTITSRATNDAGEFVISKVDGEKVERTCSGAACPASGQW